MKNSFVVWCGTAAVTVVLLLLLCSSAAAAAGGAANHAPAPAPAAREYVNLTELLSVAGPFNTFLDYLETTKVIDTFQNQANNTDDGITIFVPKDQSFNNNNQKKLSNLTQDQIKSLCLFHALPRYYSLSDFASLTHQNPIPTFAGDGPLFSLNLTDKSGTILIDSGWTITKLSSAVHASYPVAIYQIDSVLLPEAIFGTNIPPLPPAPAPAPEIALAPTADDTDHGRGNSSSPTSAPSSSPRVSSLGVFGHLIMSAIVGAGLLLFWF